MAPIAANDCVYISSGDRKPGDFGIHVTNISEAHVVHGTKLEGYNHDSTRVAAALVALCAVITTAQLACPNEVFTRAHICFATTRCYDSHVKIPITDGSDSVNNNSPTRITAVRTSVSCSRLANVLVNDNAKAGATSPAVDIPIPTNPTALAATSASATAPRPNLGRQLEAARFNSVTGRLHSSTADTSARTTAIKTVNDSLAAVPTDQLTVSKLQEEIKRTDEAIYLSRGAAQPHGHVLRDNSLYGASVNNSSFANILKNLGSYWPSYDRIIHSENCGLWNENIKKKRGICYAANPTNLCPQTR